ncbi:MULTISPECIES: GerW family sporulation protein [Virgibacillus]|uniref:Spore protein n=1 Tax=Virgibacillus pantothenticus TaxID=1473 RepID=A0A0L0QQE9_VIRPA|nr:MULTISPECIES: GerW family sporulation protein [Virgibacillus]API90847.1 sporulation protein YtfJ [Virgibacillus sp. 6R]KNE20794.1 spore protein [Virgibacillus pantothenticus]MBS7426717.1 GerW family sporulation protein [Virgibacillus sp. 19R1-5]MBU8566045.1 GerW family sporulation protein [Virgibacillus pantothenticus]MBU8602782.1 GerW family sporulation protein [Virgibacillus pantothenticus]
MDDHPIQGLMTTAMENLKDMVEANTIIGNPVQAPEGSIIIPVSKVGFGFAAGGSEFQSTSNASTDSEATLPFGGGSGGGVSITPVAFLIVSEQGIKMVHLDQQTHIYEKMLDFAPQVVDKVQEIIKSADKKQSPKKETERKEKQAPTQYDV